MNYLAEILAFEQWLETHYLPISPQLLWHKLMYLCNRSGWSEWVTVDNLRLMAAMQMTREATLIKARDELIKAGLVEYQKGKKGSPNRYRMVSVAFLTKNTFKNVVKSEAQSVVESEVYPVVEGVAESADIYKQEQKQNKRDNPPKSPTGQVELFEEFFAAYPKSRINRAAAEHAYCRVLRDDCHLTEQDLLDAARNYAEAVRILGRQQDYIRSPESFLSRNFFASYLPGQYTKPEPGSRDEKNQKNRFNQFEQNKYDFDQLEAELLEN